MSNLSRVVLAMAMVVAGVGVLADAAGAKLVTKHVAYAHEDVPLRGYLAYDDAVEGPRPGVMIVHQWMGPGEYEKMRARKLARMGYVAFAADVYGADTRPVDTHGAALASSTFREDRGLYRRRLAASLRTMKQRPRVDSDRVAAIGYCFGGTGVLELARSGADVEAVVSFHGGLTSPTPKDAADIRAVVQVHHGGQDPHVTPQHVLSFWREMKDHASVDWTLHVYSDAPHGFTEPGTDAHDERADRLSWRAMKRLFEEVFNPNRVDAPEASGWLPDW